MLTNKCKNFFLTGVIHPNLGQHIICKKMSHNIFGIVDHSDEHSMLYIFDKTVGPENTDHTISLLMHYIMARDYPTTLGKKMTHIPLITQVYK